MSVTRLTFLSLVPGDKENQIHMEGYQVSAQCMALVRDNCLLPTKDAPELGYVRESTDKQYVPDVFYKVSQMKRKEKKFFFVAFPLLFQLSRSTTSLFGGFHFYFLYNGVCS